MKFIEDLKKELSKTNLNESEIEEILNDFTEMVEEAVESGLLESDLEKKFGSPEKLANDLASEHTSNEKTDTNINTENTFEFAPEDSYNIVIELLNEDIEIETADSNKIQIEARKVRRLKDYEVKFEKNTLYIKKPRKPFTEFINFYRNSKFILKLPKQYKVKDFNFSNINGDGVIKNIDVENIKFKVTNGDFDLENNKFAKLEVDTINGTIKMKSITSNQVKASLVSGDMILKEMDITDDFNVNTVSGDIEVENVNCNQAFVRLVSGDFEGKEFYPNEITIRTVSGDVDIKNTNKEKRIEVIKKSSVSGDININ